MYRLNKMEEILNIPKYVTSCIIDSDEVLSYLYHNQNNRSCNLDYEEIRALMIDYIRMTYEKKAGKYILITQNEISKIIKE